MSDTAFPDYKQFIIHPMDFSTIEKKVRTKEYRSTDALLADVKWIYHNCYIYNNGNHPLTKNAGYFLKVTKNEMSEIEVCTDCFNNYYVHSPAERFTETCSRPHTLVWARLKGMHIMSYHHDTVVLTSYVIFDWKQDTPFGRRKLSGLI